MTTVAGCLHFDTEELKHATRNFDNRSVRAGGCKLGEGGFGPVYMGKLKNTDVAIKMMRRMTRDRAASTLATEQFETEVKVLTRFRHPNLVTLIGYSNTCDFQCLIYEFLPNGTLEDALEIGLSSTGRKTDASIYLPWMCRLSIAIDTARGLAYLHTADKKSPLVHRDVKSSNVLLDLSFHAKVGDFGLARPLKENTSACTTSRVVGTSGYIPPEYYRGLITTKMDTFGFGVILLELISGMPAYDPQRTPKDLVSYMEVAMDQNIPAVLCTMMDEHAGDWPSESLVAFFRIAKKCVEAKMSRRVEINDIYPELEEMVSLSLRAHAEQEHCMKQKTHLITITNTIN